MLVSAAVHLSLWFDAVREEDVIGPAFMLNTVGGAERLCCARVASLSPAVLTLGFDLSTLSAFHIPTTVALFGVNATWEGWRSEQRRRRKSSRW